MHGKSSAIGDRGVQAFPALQAQSLAACGRPKPAQDPDNRLDKCRYHKYRNRALEDGGVLVGDEVGITVDIELSRNQGGRKL